VAGIGGVTGEWRVASGEWVVLLVGVQQWPAAAAPRRTAPFTADYRERYAGRRAAPPPPTVMLTGGRHLTAAPCRSPRTLRRTPRTTTSPTVMLTRGRHLAAAPCGSLRTLRRTPRTTTAPHCHADQREASRCIALCKQCAVDCISPRTLRRTPRNR
jgi:hypothetical protein